MSRQQHILRTFVELADTLVEDFDLIDFLQQMTIRCQELLGATDAAVLLDHLGSRLHSVAPCNPSRDLQRVLEIACSEGPAMDAHRTARPVTTQDAEDAVTRWPQFTPDLRDSHYTFATALPMRLRKENIGSLLLLYRGEGPLSAEDLALAQALADAATIGLVHARSIRRYAVDEQLHTVLQSRIVIEQAKGILAARHDITLGEAFAFLRRHARDQGILLGRAARDVTDDNNVTPAPAPARPKDSAADTE